MCLYSVDVHEHAQHVGVGTHIRIVGGQEMYGKTPAERIETPSFSLSTHARTLFL